MVYYAPLHDERNMIHDEKNMTQAAKIIGLLLAALSALGFASTFVIGSALTRECGVSPAVLSFLRFAIAGSAMCALACATRHGRARMAAMGKKDVLTIAWLGPVGTSVMAWCVFMGCAHVSSVNASMADALAPLFIFAFAALRARRIAGGDLACLLCGFAGALLVMQIVGRHGLAIQSISVGDLYVLGGALTWAVYTVCGTADQRNPRIGYGLGHVFSNLYKNIGSYAIGIHIIIRVK